MEQQTKKAKTETELIIDLESISQQYSDHAKIDRLLFIAKNPTNLQIDAYKLAIQEIEKGYDVEKYQNTLGRLNFLLEQKPLGGRVDVDMEWVTQKSQYISEERHRLDQELSSYKSNLIKESIRMGTNDLGDHFYRAGDLSSALKCFLNTRDVLTSPLHIVDMCCRVMEVSMELGEYQNIPTYLLKAKQVPAIPEQYKIRMDTISGTVQMIQGNFKGAANLFCNIPFGSSQHLWKYVAPRDVAIYGSVCSMASLDRDELKSLVMENSNFKQYLELEPQIRDMVRAFYSSKFKICFEIWNSFRSELAMDLFLSAKVESLFALMRDRAMVQYCSPFKSFDMNRMSVIFGCTIAELELLIVNLINTNQLDARIDSHQKVVRQTEINQRQKVFRESLTTAKKYIVEARMNAVRAKLIRQGIVVKE